MLYTTLAIDVLEGNDPPVSINHTADWASFVDELHSLLPQYPKSTNHFIKYSQKHMPPAIACYAVYTAVDKGVMEFTSRNFQSMLIFNEAFKELVKYMTDEDTSRRDALVVALHRGDDLQSIMLELTSPFKLQPEEEIGKGVCTTQESVSIDGMFDYSGLIDALQNQQAASQVSTPTGTIYYDSTQYLYQFIKPLHFDDTATIVIASEKFWNASSCLDDQEISKYLEDLIPDWADNWSEEMNSVFTYIGSGNKADAIAYLKATGFFKHQIMSEDEITTILMEHLEGQPADVIAKFLKAALEKLDEDSIEELVQMYKNGWHEDTE
jgi:hypothetical protein